MPPWPSGAAAVTAEVPAAAVATGVFLAPVTIGVAVTSVPAGVAVATAGVDVTAAESTDACRGRIAAYKIPRHWKFVDEFPMTVTGKIQKYRMREMAVAELTADRTGG